MSLLVLALVCGLPDRGVFADLDAHVALLMPPGVSAERTWIRFDPTHHIATLYDGQDPVRAYGVDGRVDSTASLIAAVRPEDRDQVRQFVAPSAAVKVSVPTRAEDRDGDGIVDALDIVIGAKKLLYNGARYIERYVSIKYPGGDVPRTEGVCSDTVIRALRNAGIDLQKEIHEDILHAPAAYPMVEKIDASINHRRVRTLLPWFVRHWKTIPPASSRAQPARSTSPRSARLADRADTRYLPGDVVFFDTFPAKEGPDHLGIVSDRAGDHGLPLVINNWTDGTVDAEMDLLPAIPVTHHFRVKAASTSP